MNKLLLVIGYIFVATVLTLAVFGKARADQTTQTASQSGAVIIQDFGHNAASQPVNLSRAIGTAYAPAIPTSLITCQGGVSASAGFAGGAFALGSSIESDPCNLRLDATVLHTLGDDEGARVVMCFSKRVQEGYALIGRPCPQSNPKLNSAEIKAKSQARMLALQAEFDKRYGVK